MLDVCARQIAERIMKETGQGMPVILALSLKQYDGDTVRQVVDLVTSKRVW